VSSTVAALYGVWAILKYLTDKQIYWILADFLYWIGLMIGPFSLLDALVRVVQSKILKDVTMNGKKLNHPSEL
jgi:hypothetical protein